MGPHPVRSWWQQRTSQPASDLGAPPWGLGAWGQVSAENLTHQSPHFTLCSLPIPIWGTWAVRPGPSFLLCQIKGGWEISYGSRRLDLDIHQAGSVNTLQIIDSCMTYQLIIKLLPGPAEEIAAGLAPLCLNYQSRYSLVVYFGILYFCS